METHKFFHCKKCNKKYKSKGGAANHEKKCIIKPPESFPPQSAQPLENSFESSSNQSIREPAQECSQESTENAEKPYSENELIILKASDFDRMITDYLKIFIEHYNTQMSKLIEENRELVTYSNTLAEILKSIVNAKKNS
jgi:hypothetical protein